MQEPEPPRIEFPCDYPVKVLGLSVPEYEQTVLAIFERHAPGFDQTAISIKASRKGTFTSMTIVITATGQPQLERLHQELMDTGLVKMVI